MSAPDPYAKYRKASTSVPADPYAAYRKASSEPPKTPISRGASGSWGPTAADSGVVPALGRVVKGIANIPAAVVNAAGAPPEGEWEQDIATSPMSGLGLAVKRLVVDPAAAPGGAFEKMKAKFKKEEYVNAAVHGAAAALPVVGPMAENLSDRYMAGDKSGAIAETLAIGATPAVVEGAVKGGAAAVEAVRKTPTANAMATRVIQSWMPLNKKSLDFGRDPVAAVRQLPVAATREGMLQNIDNAIGNPSGGLESELHAAIRRRAEVAAQEGLEDGLDVGHTLRDSVKDIVERAKRNERPGVARQIENALNRRIAQITEKYGRTWLKPEEIFAEKRLLAEDTDFVGGDSASVTINKGNQAMYRALDGAFDQLLPDAKEINASYSSLIEARKLVAEQVRKIKNSSLLPETVTGALKAAVPETLAKTSLNRVLTGEGRLPRAGESALEFYRRRLAGPYEKGYEPAGAVAPGSITPVKEPIEYDPNAAIGYGGGAPSSLPAASETAPYDPSGGLGIKLHPLEKGYAPNHGPAKGMMLDSIEKNPITGKPERWTYIDSTGKRAVFSSLQL